MMRDACRRRQARAPAVLRFHDAAAADHRPRRCVTALPRHATPTCHAIAHLSSPPILRFQRCYFASPPGADTATVMSYHIAVYAVGAAPSLQQRTADSSSAARFVVAVL
jgi:hypothetical protein